MFLGVIRCSLPGLPCLACKTTVYDLKDVGGLALVHLDGVDSGPVGVVVVIPAARRACLRPEFALEFVTLLSLLGGVPRTGCEFTLHEYIEDVLRKETSYGQVFAVETAELEADEGIVLSAFFERLAAAIADWLASKDSNEPEVSEAVSAVA